MSKIANITQDLRETFNKLRGENGDLLPLAEIERRAVLLTIFECRGNMSAAAEKMGIGRSTLYRKWNEIKDSNYAPQLVEHISRLSLRIVHTVVRPVQQRAVVEKPKIIHHFVVPPELR